MCPLLFFVREAVRQEPDRHALPTCVTPFASAALAHLKLERRLSERRAVGERRASRTERWGLKQRSVANIQSGVMYVCPLVI